MAECAQIDKYERNSGEKEIDNCRRFTEYLMIVDRVFEQIGNAWMDGYFHWSYNRIPFE